MSEPELIRALGSEDPEQRRRAVLTIGEAPERGASDALMIALGDTEWRVRKEAVRVTREHALSLEMLPALLSAICQGDNVGLRNAALDVMEALGADAADVLIGALPTVSSETKKFVIEALACGGDPRVVTTLVETSRGDDVMTAVTAIEALSVIGGSGAEGALRAHLGSNEALIRMAALDGLNRLGAVLTWQQLQPLLADRMARRVAISALGRTGVMQAIEPLVTALTDRSLHMARAAVTSLVQLHDSPADVGAELTRSMQTLPEDARSRLRDLAADLEVSVREGAVQLLVDAQDEASLNEIVDLATTEMLPPRAQDALRRWGAPLTRLLLARVESRADWSAATTLELAADAAADCLLSTAPEDVALVKAVRGALRDALSSDRSALNMAAARCLGTWAEGQDAVLLVGAASRAGEDAAFACGRALSQLAEREPAAVRAAVEDVALDGVAGAPLTALIATLAGPNTLSRLQTALSAQEPSTRKAAIQGLASLPDPKVAEIIAFALADESVDVQMTAAHALGGMRTPEGKAIGLNALMLALSSESPGVRASAARALGATGEARSIPPLRELLTRDKAGVVVAAIEGLRELGDTDLSELIAPALEHDDDEVVKQALYAIADARAPKFEGRLVNALSHQAWDVRRLAAELIGTRGAASALPALRARHEHEADDLAREAMEIALRTLGGS